jgi:hypothetical protein
MGKRGPQTPRPEAVARVIVDAETFGDAEAAQRAHISASSVRAWRKTYGRDDAVVKLCAQLRQQLAADWMPEAKKLRLKLINRLGILASRGKDMREITEALRRVGDLILTNEVVHDDDLHRGSGGEAIPGEDQGSGGTPED